MITKNINKKNNKSYSAPNGAEYKKTGGIE